MQVAWITRSLLDAKQISLPPDNTQLGASISAIFPTQAEL